ncbi:hypothetical protein ACOMHN_040762 [Nucella lapillus]
MSTASSRVTSLHNAGQFMTADSLLQQEARRPRSASGSIWNTCTSSTSGKRLKSGQAILFFKQQCFHVRVEGGQIFQFRVEGVKSSSSGWRGSDLPVQGGGGQIFQFRVEGVKSSSSGWRGSNLPVQGGGGQIFQFSVDGVRSFSSVWMGSDLSVQCGWGQIFQFRVEGVNCC